MVVAKIIRQPRISFLFLFLYSLPLTYRLESPLLFLLSALCSQRSSVHLSSLQSFLYHRERKDLAFPSYLDYLRPSTDNFRSKPSTPQSCACPSSLLAVSTPPHLIPPSASSRLIIGTLLQGRGPPSLGHMRAPRIGRR